MHPGAKHIAKGGGGYCGWGSEVEERDQSVRHHSHFTHFRRNTHLPSSARDSRVTCVLNDLNDYFLDLFSIIDTLITVHFDVCFDV